MTSDKRRHYTPQEKVAILRKHLLENTAVSKLCDEHGLNPTVFYRWQQEFFEHGAAAFDRPRANGSSRDERRVVELRDIGVETSGSSIRGGRQEAKPSP